MPIEKVNLSHKFSLFDEGEFVVIPRGVEHLPVAEQEVHVMLFEPTGTLNTGNVESERTVRNLESL